MVKTNIDTTLTLDFMRSEFTKILLERNGRYLFTIPQFKVFINSILNIYNKQTKIDEDVNISKFFKNNNCVLSLHKYNISIYNQHKKNYNEEHLKIINDELYATERFFNLIIDSAIEESNFEKLTLDEEEDSNQGYIYLRPKVEYSDFLENFETVFDKTIFETDKILIKHKDGFIKINKLSDMQYNTQLPKKFKIKILDEAISNTATKTISYTLNKDGIKYELFNHEFITMNPNKKIKHFLDESEDGGIPAKVITNFPKTLIEFHLYNAEIIFEDGSVYKLLVESFGKLRQTFYDCYGFIRMGSKSNSMHVKIMYVDLIIENSYDTKLIKSEKQHNFFVFYNNILEHCAKKGTRILKRKSDTLIWMEILKTILQFSGFDPDKKTHSVYAGFQDVGKSFIIEIFRHLKFSNTFVGSAGNMTLPGLFSSSNVSITLPDAEIKNAVKKGAFSSQLVIMEEIGTAINNKSSFLAEGLEDFKLALFSPSIDLIKSGGGTVERTAYCIMTMNYDLDWIDKLRKELDIIVSEVEKDIKSGKTQVGENKNVNMFSEGSTVRGYALRELVKKYDIFLHIDDYPTKAFKFNDLNVTEIEANVFKKSIILFRERYTRKNINTGLPYSFLKRTLFSLYGSVDETRDETTVSTGVHYDDMTKSNQKKLSDLYIPNLAELIKEYITKNATKAGYFDKSRNLVLQNQAKEIIEKLVKKYPNINKFGKGSFEDTAVKLILVLQFFNDELDKPSTETIRLVEKWLYLQVNTITSDEARNFRNLEKRINYIE